MVWIGLAMMQGQGPNLARSQQTSLGFVNAVEGISNLLSPKYTED
jgi:hypothetical protein